MGAEKQNHLIVMDPETFISWTNLPEVQSLSWATQIIKAIGKNVLTLDLLQILEQNSQHYRCLKTRFRCFGDGWGWLLIPRQLAKLLESMAMLSKAHLDKGLARQQNKPTGLKGLEDELQRIMLIEPSVTRGRCHQKKAWGIIEVLCG